MSMKLTDLMKLKGKKIEGRIGGASDRFGKGAVEVLDKKEQRRRDHEAGLVPFAVKLHGDLIRQLHTLAQERQLSLNELTAELLNLGLGQPAPAGQKPAAAADSATAEAPKAAPKKAAEDKSKDAAKTAVKKDVDENTKKDTKAAAKPEPKPPAKPPAKKSASKK